LFDLPSSRPNKNQFFFSTNFRFVWPIKGKSKQFFLQKSKSKKQITEGKPKMTYFTRYIHDLLYL